MQYTAISTDVHIRSTQPEKQARLMTFLDIITNKLNHAKYIVHIIDEVSAPFLRRLFIIVILVSPIINHLHIRMTPLGLMTHVEIKDFIFIKSLISIEKIKTMIHV